MGGAGDLLAGPKGAPLTSGWAVKGWVHGCLGGCRRKEEEGHGAGDFAPTRRPAVGLSRTPHLTLPGRLPCVIILTW